MNGRPAELGAATVVRKAEAAAKPLCHGPIVTLRDKFCTRGSSSSSDGDGGGKKKVRKLINAHYSQWPEILWIPEMGRRRLTLMRAVPELGGWYLCIISGHLNRFSLPRWALRVWVACRLVGRIKQKKK